MCLPSLDIQQESIQCPCGFLVWVKASVCILPFARANQATFFFFFWEWKITSFFSLMRLLSSPKPRLMIQDRPINVLTLDFKSKQINKETKNKLAFGDYTPQSGCVYQNTSCPFSFLLFRVALFLPVFKPCSLACLLIPVVLPTNFLFLKINRTNFCCFHPKHPKCIRNEWDRPNLSFQNLII